MDGIGVFAIKTILWFLFWLACWYVSSALFMAPVYLLTKGIVAALFPAWAEEVRWVGHNFILFTSLHYFTATNGHAADLAVRANFVTYGIGWPLIVALLLASDADRIILKTILATSLLLIPQSVGISIEFLHAVYVQSGLLILGATKFNIIIILFEFMIMVAPPLSAVMLWLWLEQRFVRDLVFSIITTGKSENDHIEE
ncbi:MAG: exosortase H-associated membrane protein [Thiomonas sp.]|uniref:exosortase H-associated membrane protein n=1 Tax=Thiomonas sp. TaxID=2047785 RepID=UPI002A364C4C|nr:exosortase H-associated membrane protein [Thiomonas sp.]MDY0331691.1 exosortase H-associated membrane protein [Thiomonas sp.]